MHDQHGLPLVAQLAQQREDDPLRGRVDPRHRLVHEIHVGSLSQRSGQKRPLLLAAGKLSDLPIGQVGQAHLRQAIAGPGDVGRARSFEPPQPAERSHQHEVAHAHGRIPVAALALRNVADAAALRRHGPAEHADAAADQRHQTQDRLDERAFAGAVRPDDGDQLRLVQRQVDIPQNGALMIRHRNVVNVEHGGVGCGRGGVHAATLAVTARPGRRHRRWRGPCRHRCLRASWEAPSNRSRVRRRSGPRVRARGNLRPARGCCAR